MLFKSYNNDKISLEYKRTFVMIKLKLVLFCRGGCHFCTRGHFCTATFLHVETFAPLYLLHDVTFAWRHFCKASLLHGVIFSQKYLCTAKILNNWSILNGGLLLHASKF